MKASTSAKSGRLAASQADKENLIIDSKVSSCFLPYHSKQINSSKFQNLQSSQTASQNLLHPTKKAEIDSCDQMKLVQDEDMTKNLMEQSQRTPNQKFTPDSCGLSRQNSERLELHQHLLIEKLNNSLNLLPKNSNHQQKSTVHAEQSFRKPSLPAISRQSLGSCLKATRSSILTPRPDPSSSLKPNQQVHRTPLIQGTSGINLSKQSTTIPIRYPAATQSLCPNSLISSQPRPMISSSAATTHPSYCCPTSSTTAATPGPFPHEFEPQLQPKKQLIISQFTEEIVKSKPSEDEKRTRVQAGKWKDDRDSFNRENYNMTGTEDIIRETTGNDEIGKRMISSGSRFKRTGHVYVQRHSNKKKQKGCEERSGGNQNGSNKKLYCDIGDKQLPDKFLSPHSDNEDYAPPIQREKIKLSKKFNPSEVNQDREDSKDERQKENSLLSEAINAVNINSSILSNEPINQLGCKIGAQTNYVNQFQKQNDDQCEFKLPLEVKRVDSCMSKQFTRPKQKMYSFGGAVSRDRKELQLGKQKSNDIMRANKYANDSNSINGQDQEMMKSQISNSEKNGPQENYQMKGAPSFKDQDSRYTNDVINDNDHGDEYSFFQEQMEGTEYGCPNTQNECTGSVQGNIDIKYNRKDMSLGKLCRKFLKIYGKEQKGQLLLDQCTHELGVERRRIYDIINILESFSVIRRQAKNSYYWRGLDQIVNSIQSQIRKSQQSLEMQDLSIKTKSKSVVQDRQLSRLQNEKENMNQNGQIIPGDAARSIDISVDSQSIALNKLIPQIKESEEASVSMATSYLPNHIELQSDDEEDDEMLKQMQQMHGGRIKKYKKDKSLGILCQNFIHLFVTWKSIISLEEAAKRINERQEDINVNKKEQKLKTKIRRLYDIANVLSSLGLIEKCQALNSKKPAFKWIGLEGTIKSLDDLRNEPLNTPREKFNLDHSQSCIKSQDPQQNERQFTSKDQQRIRSDIPQQVSEKPNTQSRQVTSQLDKDVFKGKAKMLDSRDRHLKDLNRGNINKTSRIGDQSFLDDNLDVNGVHLDTNNNYNQLHSKNDVQINNQQILNQQKYEAIVDQQILGSQSQILQGSTVRQSNLQSIQNLDITDQLKTRMNVTNPSTLFQTGLKTTTIKTPAQRYPTKPGQHNEQDLVGLLTPEVASSNFLLKKRGAASISTVRRHDQTNGSSSSQIQDGFSPVNQNGNKAFKRSQRLRTEQLDYSKKNESQVEEQNTQATIKGELKQPGKRLNGNLTQIINEIDQKEPHDYTVMKSWLESCERSQDSSHNGASYQPHKFINEDEENEIVRQVQTQQRQLMQIDPLGELDVALMDRNTASKNRYHHILNNPLNNSTSPAETKVNGKSLSSVLAAEAIGKSDNTDASDSKLQEQVKKQRPVRNKNNSNSERSSDVASDKQSRKKSQKVIPAQNTLNKRQVKQASKGKLSQISSPLKNREVTAICQPKADEDVQISGKSVRSQNIQDWTDKNKGADSQAANAVSEMTSVKINQDKHQPILKKSTFQSELLFGCAANLWKAPPMDRNLRKLNSGSNENKSSNNLTDFESHTSKMICLSSMIDFTYQLEMYRRQRETLFGLFKDLACQQNN